MIVGNLNQTIINLPKSRLAVFSDTLPDMLVGAACRFSRFAGLGEYRDVQKADDPAHYGSSALKAEREGFEPSVPQKGTPVFETGTFGRSVISPGIVGPWC